MMPLQNTATKIAIKPTSSAAGATNSGYVDTLGYDEAAVDVSLDTQAAVSSNPSVLKLSHSDITDATGFADITGFVGDATDGFVIPNADTANPQIVRLNVDLRARKRYLKVTVTPAGATQLIAAVVTLGKADNTTVARAQMAAVVDG